MLDSVPFLEELELWHLMRSLENLDLAKDLLKRSQCSREGQSVGKVLEIHETREILQILADSLNCAAEFLQNRFRDSATESNDEERNPLKSPDNSKEKVDDCGLTSTLGLSHYSAMDLRFVTERILSLSFSQDSPAAACDEALREAAQMLHTKHGENFMVYNLSEHCPETSCLNDRVLDFGWLEPLAPPLQLLCSICKSLDSWLRDNPRRVAVLFSSTGLEHVGVVVSAYLHLIKSPDNREKSLDQFAMQRFLREQVGTLLRPSSKRYVDCFGGLLSKSIKVNSSPLFLHHITVVGVPTFDSFAGCRPFFKVYQGSTSVYTSPVYHVNESSRSFTMSLERGLHLRGDVLIRCYHRYTQSNARDIVFTIQFHTCAVADSVMVFRKEDIDDASKDPRFPLEGSVHLHFSSDEDLKHLPRNACPFQLSSDDPVARYDSFEDLHSTGDLREGSSCGLRYTQGPVDGSLYATVAKRKICVSTDSGRDTQFSGSSSEHSPVFSDPSPTPSPTEEPKMAATTAATYKREVLPLSETSELDQLLKGMLLDVQNIPDIRASQTKNLHTDIDIDTVQTNFDLACYPIPKNDTTTKSYIYESDTVRRVATTNKKRVENTRYPNGEGSDTTNRFATTLNDRNTYQAMEGSDTIRRVATTHSEDMHYLNGGGSDTIRRANTTPKNDTHYFNEGGSDTIRRTAITPRDDTEDMPYHAREDSKPFTYGIVSSNKVSPGTIPSKTLPNSPLLMRKFSNGTPVATVAATPVATPLSRSVSYGYSDTPIATSSPQPPHAEDESIQDFSAPSENSRLDGSWLQRQQQKLEDRKGSFRYASDRRVTPAEPRVRSQRPGDDGYLSDATLNTSREASPDVNEGIYATPLRVGSARYAPSSASATQHPALLRQRSDMSNDRSDTLRKRNDPVVSPILNYNTHARYRATADATTGLLTTVADEISMKEDSLTSWSSSTSGDDSLGINRPTTPGFPVAPRTPYLNARHFGYAASPASSASPPATTVAASTSQLPPKSPTFQTKDRSPSPSSASLYMGQSRRSSVSGGSDVHDVSPAQVNFVKDNISLWYKPHISREDAINLLRDKPPGTFIVRDSNSFPGAFGLVLKVATPPPQSTNKKTDDPAAELIRHFLIESNTKGVRVKGCPNEPTFGSLSALVYQHSVTPLALPCKLILPEHELGYDVVDSVVHRNPVTQLLAQGASCNVQYLFTMDTESLTGPQAIHRAVSQLLQCKPPPLGITVHFKVTAQGITLTDNERKLFFRRHYQSNSISFCGLDPEGRSWQSKPDDSSAPLLHRRCFGFVARKAASKADNQCHVFAELEPEQPASAVVHFVTKVLLDSSINSKQII